MKKGRLVIISGPSGSGKSTIIRALMEQSPGASVRGNGRAWTISLYPKSSFRI